MNCLYCNSKCFYDPMCADYSCMHCKYKPSFLDWNDYEEGGLFAVENYMMVIFLMPPSVIIYDPTDQKLDTLLGSFKINEIVTPDNLERIIERIENLKVFI